MVKKYVEDKEINLYYLNEIKGRNFVNNFNNFICVDLK